MRIKSVLWVCFLIGCSPAADPISNPANNGTGGNGTGGNADMAIPVNGGGGGGGGGSGGGGDSCAHSVCTSGAALNGGCDACATQVCASDSYCCSTSWNSRCVTEAMSICGSSACGGGGGGGGG